MALSNFIPSIFFWPAHRFLQVNGAARRPDNAAAMPKGKMITGHLCIHPCLDIPVFTGFKTPQV